MRRRIGRHSTPTSLASQALNPAGSRGCHVLRCGGRVDHRLPRLADDVGRFSALPDLHQQDPVDGVQHELGDAAPDDPLVVVDALGLDRQVPHARPADLSSAPSTWILPKQSGIGTDHNRSGTTYWPISGSSWDSKRMIGLIASSASRASKSRSTTSKVGDLRRDSYSETDDCWVSAHTASWRWDTPAALRATSMTVFGGYTATEYR